MIKKIILKYFGKYINSAFDISPVTVFIGKNESGKTTLFDAVFDCICRPNNKIFHGKRLKNRYGDSREAELIFDAKIPQIEPDQFLNLNAVHSGNTDLDFSSGNSWIDKIKSALFYGGIDPAPIIYELEQESSTHANKPHIKELKKAEEEKERIEEELVEINSKKEQILNNEKLIYNQSKDLKNLKSQSEKINSRIDILRKQLDGQNKIKQRNEYIILLEFLNKGSRLKEQLSELEYFKTDESSELNKIDENIKSLESKLQSKKGYAQSLEEDINNRKEKLEIKNRQKEEKKYTSEIADGLLSKLKNIETTTIKKIKWNPILLILSAAFFASGIILFLAVPGFELKTVLLSAGLISGIIILFLSKKDILIQDTSMSNNLVMEIKDEWNTRTRDRGKLEAKTKDGLARELMQNMSEYHGFREIISEEISEIVIKEKEYRECMKTVSVTSSEIENKKRELESKLSGYGLGSIFDYYKKLENYNNLSNSYKDWEGELSKKLESYSTKDISIARTETELKIRKLDDEITEEKKTEIEMNNISKELSELEAGQEKLVKNKLSLEKEISENEGIVKGSLGDIPEKTISLEKSKLYIEEKINEMNLNIKASAFAKEIFKEISEDMDTVLYDLQDEIKDKFSKIVPDLRNISLKKLDKEAISITDAGGKQRTLDNLSRGTIDTFYFSARLALLQRALKEPSILVLDEPFHSMDREREIKSLKLLYEFHKTNNLQIILFTKDESIKENLTDIFSDVKIHLLEQTK